jgi:glycosyltransferase involved in cell wall biosynthesis
VRIALDSSYSADRAPSGIAVYSREILNGLAAAYPEEQFLHCYRAKQFRQSSSEGRSNVRRRLLCPPLPTFHADLFHALNQRVEHRPAKKVVATFHDLFVLTAEYSTPAFRKRFARQAQEAARRSDLLIAVSAFTAGQICDHLGYERARIRVIPHGVNLPAHDIRESEREKLILFVGALQVRKNVLRLLEAFEALVLEGELKDWRLVLAGSPTGYGGAEILERIDLSICRERIDVPGYLPERALKDLYARASIFAFPSLDEGFGIPVLEAMAYGVPVVTSKTSALPEVAGDAALLIDPLDCDALADALRRLATDEAMRADMAQKGRQRASLYSWKRAVESTYGVYRELLLPDAT